MNGCLLSEEQRTKAIVPVRCGSYCGTAFLVEGANLLTARHVVDEYFNGGKPVLACFEGKDYTFVPKQVQPQGYHANDVVLLTCNDAGFAQIQSVKELYLKLLSIPYDQIEGAKLSVIGFPTELGGGNCQIETCVRPHSHIIDNNRKYDVVTVREGAFKLKSFCGYSGSPVLTQKGYVVGVVSTENFGKLTFCSVNRMEKRLKTLGVSQIETKWEAFDDSNVSLQNCENQVYKAIQRASGRYHEEEHTPNKKQEEKIRAFYDYPTKVKTQQLLREFAEDAEKEFVSAMENKAVVSKLPAGVKVHFQGDDYGKLPEYIEALRNVIQTKTPYRETLKRLKESAEQSLERLEMMQKQLMCLHGNAGTGKTQLSCHLARGLAKEQKNNVYLLFGSQFDSSMDAWDRMLSQLKLTEDDIKRMEERAAQNNHYAVLFIDALNEGAGDTYWKLQLDLLIKKVQAYPHLKLVFTIRDPFTNGITENIDEKLYESVELTGFTISGTTKAIDKYFVKYGIDPKYKSKYRRQFRKPLFLIIFCESYRLMSKAQRDNVNLRQLYESYLTSRNVKVSELVDEDEKRNVTLMCMRQLAWFSVEQRRSGLIPRQNARRIADKICPMRTWKNNLLRALLIENILMDTLSDQEVGDLVMFEFENIADVMKAESLLTSKLTDMQIVDLLVRTEAELTQKGLSKAKFENMVRALIALWDRRTTVTTIGEFTTGKFSLQLVKAKDEYGDEQNYKLISDWIKQNKEMYHPRELLSHLDDDESNLFDTLHPYLRSLEMNKRDEEWTILVNDYVENPGGLHHLARMSRNLKYRRRFLIVAVWMLTTSDPDARMFLIRLLYRLLLECTDDIPWLLERFPSCNDHYVLQGLYCAIYGVCLRSRDNVLLKNIAETVYRRYYEHGKDVPVDIVLRQWTLKIMERAAEIDSTADYFKRIKLPFKSRSPYKDMLKNEIPEGYFGDGKGASLLYYSMGRGSDFHRYTLGSNNFSDSGEFFVENGEDGYNPVSLYDIPNMMAPIIRYRYKYNEELSHYDANRYSKDRHHNKTERIGKKYQWLALFEVYARLSDNCMVKDQRLGGWSMHVDSEDLTREAWPWMTRLYDRFDPTLPSNEETKGYVEQLKLMPEKDEALVDDVKGYGKWLDMAATNPTVKMQWLNEDGCQWVRLYGFESVDHQQDIEKHGTMLYYNSAFVRKTDSKKMSDWAKKQSFNGRWMAERSDCIDFLWNEMPWSNSYKRLGRNEWEEGYDSNPYPCKLMVAYDEQLQEDNYGFLAEEERYSYSEAMPCAELMEEMELYTAERGLVRKKVGNDIVAISMGVIHEDIGLLIRKDILCEFMRRKHYHLYTYILGSKEVIIGNTMVGEMKNLSACMLMDEKGVFTEVQKLHIVEEKKQKTIVADPERIAFLKKKNHEEGLTNLELLELLEMERMLKEQEGE